MLLAREQEKTGGDEARARIREVLEPYASDWSSKGRCVRLILRTWIERLHAFVAGESFPPFEVEVQISSRCNYSCRWCVGTEIQRSNRVLRLPNSITCNNVDCIIDGILDYQAGGMQIEIVKFSGFIGEPLVPKKATLKAIQRLVGAGRRVGLFTNGYFMDAATWPTLAGMEYIHVSLDGGPATYNLLKTGGNSRGNPFERVIANIEGMIAYRRSRPDSRTTVNVGYVVTPDNAIDILEAVRIVHEAGADSFRFKIDITADSFPKATLESVFSQIEQAKRRFESERFQILVVHEREDVEQRTYRNWRREQGCPFQAFFTTIGSDGNLYLCDHNTMPCGLPLGNVVNDDFQSLWEGRSRAYLCSGIEHTCQSTVCPPMANAVNPFLAALLQCAEEFGPEPVRQVLDELHQNLPEEEF